MPRLKGSCADWLRVPHHRASVGEPWEHNGPRRSGWVGQGAVIALAVRTATSAHAPVFVGQMLNNLMLKNNEPTAVRIVPTAKLILGKSFVLR